MPVAMIAAFWGVSMLFVLTPGADWAYAISSGLRNRSMAPALGGLLSGHLLATIVVAAGVAALLAHPTSCSCSPWPVPPTWSGSESRCCASHRR